MIDLLELAGNEAAVEATSLARKLTIAGQTKTYQVYRIRLDLLRYNVLNDRIATWVSEYQEEHGGCAPDESNLSEFNDIIEGYIYRSDPERLDATKRNIAEHGQQEPGVVLPNGLVIDGNRRFTCLRQLARDSDKFGWFEASILPAELGGNREALKCLELALQFGREERVGYDPVDRLVGVYRDLIDPETKIPSLSVEKYARSANIPVAKLNGYMTRANLMVEFLDFINAPKRFSLARNLKIDGPLGELENLFKKCHDREEQERVKAHAFANILVEPRDITRFLREMKKIIAAGDCEEYLAKEDELTERVLMKLETLPDMTAETIREEIRSDADLKWEMDQTVKNAAAGAKRSGLMRAPIKAFEAARASLEQVDPAILAHYTPEQQSEIREGVMMVREILDEIEGALNV